MAVETSQSIRSPISVLSAAEIAAASLRATCEQFIAACDAGAVKLQDLANAWLAQMVACKAAFTAAKTVQGIAAHARAVYANPDYDPVAEWTALNAELTTAVAWCEANWPMDASRRMLNLVLSNDGTGTVTQATITAAAARTALRARLVAIRDLIKPPA